MPFPFYSRANGTMLGCIAERGQMDKLIFSVLGSKGDIYEIAFEKTENKLHAFCTCQAGQSGTYCKHRFGLMNGEYDRLVSRNVDDLEHLREMLDGSELEAKYNAVVEAERAHAASKRRLDAAKVDLARAMYR